MRCDSIATCSASDIAIQFQSLLGFLMRCDTIRESCHSSARFQSLLGFLMRCDSEYASFLYCYCQVSIPAGFSDALRLVLEYYDERDEDGFQSLLGFLMRCDENFAGPVRNMKICFNPCWVF